MSASGQPEASGTSRLVAAHLLGCRPDAKPDEVRAAFRRTALTAHPDHGGDHTTDLAALAAARDLLVQRGAAARTARPRAFNTRHPLWHATRRLLRRRRHRSASSTTRRVI